MCFDKDDELAMDFVIAASNIRAQNFGIPMESAFKIKEMAGKIVPAISSSNALVASLQVVEAIKLLSRNYQSLQTVAYGRLDQKNRLSSTQASKDLPNPLCGVCADDSLTICTVTV